MFSSTEHYSIGATLFQTVAALIQPCNAVLRWESSLQIVSSNITFLWREAQIKIAFPAPFLDVLLLAVCCLGFGHLATNEIATNE